MYLQMYFSYHIFSVYLIAWGLLGNVGREDLIGPVDESAFRNLMVICLGIGFIASILYQTTVKVDTDESEDGSEIVPEFSGTPTVLKWFKEYQMYQVAIVYMSTRLFVNLSQAYIPLYLQITLKLPAKYVATVPLTMFLSGFFTSLCMKKTNHLLGRKITYIIGASIGIAGCIWIRLGFNDDENTKYYIFVVASILGIGGSCMLVTALALTAEFIGADTDASAFIYGVMSLTDKVSNGLAVVLIQHFIPTKIDTCILCRQYFRDVILYCCGGAALLGIIGIISLMKTTIGNRRVLANTTTTTTNLVINDDPDDERTPLI